MKKIHFFLLLVLPILLLITGLYIKSSTPDYSLYSVDPEYAYLFNGLNLAHLCPPWHIDHPGTPLQVLIAIVIRVTHIFHNHSTPLLKDIFTNPDYYLNCVSGTLISINALSLLILGFFSYRATKSVTQSLFLQLLPFTSTATLEIMHRVMVEHLIISITMLLVTAIIVYINKKHENERVFNKNLILIGILTALGIATKITFFPVIFVPFFIFPGIQKKLAYSLVVLVSTTIFISPIFDRWVYFRDWITRLILHTGQYGKGEANIIDPLLFKVNLKSIFTQEFFYPKVFILILIAVIFYFVVFKKATRKNDLYFRGLAGILLAMITLTLLVAKQYKYFYLIPVLLLIIPGIYFIIKIYFRQMPRLLNNKIIASILLVLFAGLVYLKGVKILFSYLGNSEDRPILETLHVVEEKYQNKPTCILPAYSAAPYKEYALFFGTAWSGDRMKEKYSHELIHLYPNTYVYHDWNKMFNYWDGKAFSFIELLKKYHQLILYVGDPYWEEPFFCKHIGINRELDTHFAKVYNNENTKEAIYEVIHDTSNYNTEYLCDAEKLDESGKYFFSEDGHRFQNGNTQSQEQYKSGKCSSKLTQDNPYGMTAVLSEVETGDHYKISCWINNNSNKNASLVVAEYTSNEHYSATNEVTDSLNSWKKIETDFVATDNLHSKSIKIYCYNYDTNLPAYFDDLKIVKCDK